MTNVLTLLQFHGYTTCRVSRICYRDLVSLVIAVGSSARGADYLWYLNMYKENCFHIVLVADSFDEICRILKRTMWEENSETERLNSVWVVLRICILQRFLSDKSIDNTVDSVKVEKSFWIKFVLGLNVKQILQFIRNSNVYRSRSYRFMVKTEITKRLLSHERLYLRECDTKLNEVTRSVLYLIDDERFLSCYGYIYIRISKFSYFSWCVFTHWWT